MTARVDVAEALQSAMAEQLERIRVFTETPAFSRFLDDLLTLSVEQRYEVIELLTTDESSLAAVGIKPPSGIVFQRSEFADMRPTLFCLVAKLPPGLGWRKVTVTIDNPLQSEYRGVNLNNLERA